MMHEMMTVCSFNSFYTDLVRDLCILKGINTPICFLNFSKLGWSFLETIFQMSETGKIY